MKLLSFIIIIAVAFPLSALPAWGISFDPAYIISDEDFFAADDITIAEVQSFLARKKSTLADYTSAAADGTRKSAAAIIWEAAHKNGINPKALLVLLQKEQSLIENPRPSQYNYDWATGYARCDACPASDPVVAAYKGFATQVEKAAWRKKYYTINPGEFTYRAGMKAVVDGVSLIPKNSATAALYNYTPHLRGNFSFWKLWQRYFGKMFPDGMLVKEDGTPDIWLIQDGKKRRITSMSVFRSRYAERNLVTVSARSLETYAEGTPVRFMQYSLLQVPTGGIYLVTDDGKYSIPSQAVFKSVGFNPAEVIRVTEQDLADVPTIGVLSNTQSPIGELVQDIHTGGIFALSNGVKHPILERALLETNFPRTPIRPDRTRELDSVLLGEPVLFSDGALVKEDGNPTVYIISHGQKRPFVSEEAFTTLGFSWNQIVTTTGYTLALHSLGETIDTGRIIEEDFQNQLTSLAANL